MKKFKVKHKIFALLFISIALFALWRFLVYGSVLNGCVYTEDVLPVPGLLASGQIVVANKAYVASGTAADSCMEQMGQITREIVGPETINNISIGRRYFTDRGLNVEVLKKGTRLSVVGVVAVTKHGITTIDSGPGPIYHLILKDSDGALYQVATVSLGINKGGSFLSFESSSYPADSSTIRFLSWESFEEQRGERPSLIFTGQFVEHDKTSLDLSRSPLDKLYFRLVEGEKITIQIVLESRAGTATDILLSSENSKRKMQVAEIQEVFLRKVRDKFNLEGLVKNEHHPSLSVEVTPELLDYLSTERYSLNIKSIGELTRL